MEWEGRGTLLNHSNQLIRRQTVADNVQLNLSYFCTYNDVIMLPA